MSNDMQVQCSICGEFHVADQIGGTRNEIITRYRHDMSALRAQLETANREWTTESRRSIALGARLAELEGK